MDSIRKMTEIGAYAEKCKFQLANYRGYWKSDRIF